MKKKKKANASYTNIVRGRMKKYERALIALASFDEGEEVTSYFDEPETATTAREALGKRICNKFRIKPKG